VSASLVLAACGQIFGFDEYSVGSDDGAGALATCGVAGARDGGADCVGVTSCPSWAASDKQGACTPLLPTAACDATTCVAPCITGSPEILGQSTCTPTSSVWFSCKGKDKSGKDAYPDVPLGAGAVRYVRSGATVGESDGSPTKPFATIAEALAGVPPNGTVLIAPGTYAEDLVMDKPGVQLIGTCPDQVVISGTGAPNPPSYPCGYSGRAAAICVAASAKGSDIESVTVTGAADGIAVVGATDVRMQSVQVTQTERYGIRIEEFGKTDQGLDDVRSPASATLSAVSVRGARGVGVYVAGATVHTGGFLNVSGTRQLNEYQGYGVSVVPGAVVNSIFTTFARTPGNVTLTGALLSGNADAALHVSGSTVTVKSSFLGNLAGTPPLGRGLLVERDIAGSQNLADVTLSETIIERTRDAAVDVRSATLTLEDSTIRDTFGRSGDGCSGQGIRVRADRLAPAAATVRHSVIDGSRQAAIHSLGGAVTVEHSILRGSAPGDAAKTCAPHLGDGVTLESLPSPGDRTTLTLDHSLVDGNARAAVASFGGAVTASASVLSCSAHDLAASGDLPGTRTDLRCGCNGKLRDCSVDHTALEPWISPGLGSGHPSTETWRMKVQTAFYNRGVTNGIALLLDLPEVAPGFPDSQGIATLAGVPKDLDADRRRLATWAEGGNTAGILHVPMGVVPDGTSTIGMATVEQAKTFITGEPVDANKAYLFVGGTGTANASGAPTTQSPDSGASWVSVQSFWMRYNVDPGWVTFALPDGFKCLSAPVSGEVISGATDSLRLLAEPGMVSNAIGLTCFAPGPCGSGFPDPAHAGQCLNGPAAQAACLAAATPLASDGSGQRDTRACGECSCSACRSMFETCLSDPACVAFLKCTTRTGCTLASCATLCPSEIAAVSGNPLSAVVAFGDCTSKNCPACSPADGG
jgi:hypothetical protein